jgi:hemerythrin-like domain-containing protein
MIDDIDFLDDATRPRAPKLEGLTEVQRGPGHHLKDIHDHLRRNMQMLRGLIERASAGEVAAATRDLAMVANFRRFGNLCGQYCQFVHGHHSIEDAHLFPGLAAKSAAWKRVTDRLEAEHVVVHELLIRLLGALEALAAKPDREAFEAAVTVYDALERVLLSHLGYEEEEIGDAIGYFGLL